MKNEARKNLQKKGVLKEWETTSYLLNWPPPSPHLMAISSVSEVLVRLLPTRALGDPREHISAGYVERHQKTHAPRLSNDSLECVPRK